MSLLPLANPPRRVPSLVFLAPANFAATSVRAFGWASAVEGRTAFISSVLTSSHRLSCLVLFPSSGWLAAAASAGDTESPARNLCEADGLDESVPGLARTKCTGSRAGVDGPDTRRPSNLAACVWHPTVRRRTGGKRFKMPW